MDYSEIYRKRIRTLCEERGISINRLSTMSGVSQSTLDNIMRGLSKNRDYEKKSVNKILL